MLESAFRILGILFMRIQDMCMRVELLGNFTLWHLILGTMLISFFIPTLGLLFKINYAVNSNIKNHKIGKGE